MNKSILFVFAVLMICSLTVESKLYLSQKLKGSSAVRGVSITNEYAAYGSINDDTKAENAGSVVIYKYENMTDKWEYMETIFASDASADAQFGSCVSIDLNYIIVGTWNSNQAYIFKLNETDYDNNSWYQVSMLTATTTEGSDTFGESCDISGGYAIVGDPYNDDIDTFAGGAYIFSQTFDEYGEEAWIQNQTLYGSDTDLLDQFGADVSISNGYVVIGTFFRAKIYVFALNQTTKEWQQIAGLTQWGSNTAQTFGKSVTIDAETNAGIVTVIGTTVTKFYVFSKNISDDTSSSWDQIAVSSSTNNGITSVGLSVAIYNETFVLGGYYTNDSRGDINVWQVRLNDTIDTRTWQKTDWIAPSNSSNNDEFGTQVDIFGDWVIVGAYGDNKAYIYGGVKTTRVTTMTPTRDPIINPTMVPTMVPTVVPTMELTPTEAPASETSANSRQEFAMIVIALIFVHLIMTLQ